MRTVIAAADSSTLTTALFTFVGVLVAAIATILVGIINYRQARSGHVTDRLTKAVEQLGSSDPLVRMGAIFALEQIVADSSHRSAANEHRFYVADQLAALIRSRSHSTANRYQSYVAAMLAALVRFRSSETLTPKGAVLKVRVPDVQAALTVLCRYPVCNDHMQSDEKGRLDLSRSVLPRASLCKAQLERADLSGARLQGADLRQAKLRGAILKETNLGPAAGSRYLGGADLKGADLTEADLTGAVLDRAILDRAIWSKGLEGTTWPLETSSKIEARSTEVEHGKFCIEDHTQFTF